MANKKVTVEVDIEIEPSLKALRELKNQLKSTAAGSAEFKKLENQIRDVEDAIEEGKQSAKGWADVLEEADGPLGLLGRGIRQAQIAFSSFNNILKVSVIGLVASAIAGLVAAFMNSETAMKKLQPLFIGLEKILGGIFRVFEPVLDSFIELAEDVLPYVTKGVGMFYSAIVGLFTYIKTAGGAVIDFWTSLLTLDFEGAGNAIKKGLNSFNEAGKAYTDSMARFTAGTKEMTKTEKENAEELKAIEDKKRQDREAAQKKLEEDRKKAFEDRLENMQANDALDMAMLEKQKAVALAAAQTEQEKLAVEEKYAKLSYEIRRKDILDKRALYPQGSKEYKDYTKQLVELETEYINISAQNAQKRLEQLKKTQEELKTLSQDLFEDEFNLELAKEKMQANLIEDATEKALRLEEIRYQEELDAFEKKETELIDKLVEFKEKEIELRKQTGEDITAVEEEFAEKEEFIFQQTKEILTLVDKQYAENKEKIIEDSLNKERAARVKSVDEELKLLGLRSEVLLQGTRAYFDNRREIINASERKELESAELTEQTTLAIQRKYAEQRKQLKQDEWAAFGKITSEAINSIAAVTGALASSYDLEAEESEKAFNKRKKLQKATALMSAASGIIQILTQPSTLPSPFDWIVKGINAVALGVATKVQIDKIDKTEFKAPSSGGAKTSGPIQVQRRAKGGMINGPGTSTSDSIPAMLSNGEFVVNARATETFEPLLRSINNFGLQPRFAAGGMMSMSSVNRPSGDNLSETLTSIIANQPIRTYVTSNEITNQQQFDRVIKTRSMI